MGRPRSRPPLGSFLQYWEQAAANELGLFIECHSEADKAYLANTLYECRSTFGGYTDITLVKPATVNVIFLMNKLEMEIL